jgi:hypothetical protein
MRVVRSAIGPELEKILIQAAGKNVRSRAVMYLLITHECSFLLSEGR